MLVRRIATLSRW